MPIAYIPLITLGVLEIFADFFGNLFNIVFALIFLLSGILVGIFLRPWFGNQVIKLMPKDHRFVDFDVQEETAVSINCKTKKGYPAQRFFKYAPGFTGVVGMIIKKPITRFLGKEGTAYTWFVGEQAVIDLGTLAQAVKHVWGDVFYNAVPDEQRHVLEKSKIDVTVDLAEGLTPDNFRTIGEEDIKREEDREAARTFWTGKKVTERTQWVSLVITLVAGFGIACALQILGILRI